MNPTRALVKNNAMTSGGMLEWPVISNSKSHPTYLYLRCDRYSPAVGLALRSKLPLAGKKGPGE